MSGSTRACSRYRWGCVLLLLGLLCAFGGQAAAKPNVIFFLTDDQGWQDLACYGHPYLKTPNFDRLAREGTRFEQFYVNASVCSPSRAAF
jgi:N-acetylgalactosamine-6-sulfatase|tara:strand:+ start:4672 stop:4941 length:270 start_codon:yes stop_codon:yes gene_type:complete